MMIMNTYRFRGVLLWIVLFFVGHSYGQTGATYPFEKTLHVTTENLVKVVNNLGDIRIVGWDREIIQLEIIVRDSKNGKILQHTNALTPQIIRTGQEITIAMKWEDQSENWFSSWINDKIKSIGKSDFWVGYTLHVPNTMDLNIVNEFGNVSIESWDSDLYIDQQHGQLVIDGNISNANGVLKFVEAKFGSVSRVKMDLKQTNIEANSIDVFESESVGGVYEIENIGQLNLVSSRDELKINYAARCDIDANFSEIIIDTLSERSKFEIQFVTMNILGFRDGIVPLDINQRSSQVSVFVGDDPFEFKGQVDGGTLRLPLSTKILQVESLDNKDKQKKIHAHYGNGVGETINLISKNGNVIFKNQ